MSRCCKCFESDPLGEGGNGNGARLSCCSAFYCGKCRPTLNYCLKCFSPSTPVSDNNDSVFNRAPAKPPSKAPPPGLNGLTNGLNGLSNGNSFNGLNGLNSFTKGLSIGKSMTTPPPPGLASGGNSNNGLNSVRDSLRSNLLIQCESRLSESGKLLNEEGQRLERLSQATDSLNKSLKTKLGNLGIRELLEYDNQLKKYKENYMLNKKDVNNTLLLELHEHIDQTCRAISKRKEQFKKLKPIQFKFNDDDEFITLDLNKEKDPGLIVAASVIQDVLLEKKLRKELELSKLIAEQVKTPPPSVNNINNSCSLFSQGLKINVSTLNKPNPLSLFNNLIEDGGSSVLSSLSSDDDDFEPVDKFKPAKKGAMVRSSWSDVAKVNAENNATKYILPRPAKTVAETNSPHCYMDIKIGMSSKLHRIVIRLRPDVAPFMCKNFLALCSGEKGFGFKGCSFFKAKPGDHVMAGDFESNNGEGGYSAMDNCKLFVAEQCKLKDVKGGVRMRGIDRTPEGRVKVGSQFLIWVGDIEFREYQYTLIFAHVTDNSMEILQKISDFGMMQNSDGEWVVKENVVIEKCGVL